ncbi:MAG: SpoIIE family protein phosphatase [Flavobacteriales bacterium]|nr:SpoIIE family protein phosphatase [Flavobacteriales bacterium]
MERGTWWALHHAFIGTVDTRTGTIRYVNAGHNAPVILARRRIKELKSGAA